MQLTTLEIRERKIDVNVDDKGTFGAHLGEQWITAASLEELREKLIRLTRNTKITIPFIEWDGKKIRRGTVNGRHAANNNLLVKYDDAARGEQASSWSLDDAMDPACEAEYVEICRRFEAVKLEKEQCEDKHGLDVRKLIDQAMAAAEGSK